MSKLRLPISDLDIKKNELIFDLKSYYKKFVNKVFLELKEQLSNYHITREIEGKKNLLMFFRQKIADFELLCLLNAGVKYLDIFNEIDNNNNFEDIANRLAFIYENLKTMISPSWNIISSFRTMIPESKLSTNSEYSGDKHLERLLKIYLNKENLEFFQNITVKNNIVLFNNTYKVALCGEINNPKFVLLDEKISIKDFTIKKFVLFLNLQEKYTKLQALFKKFKTLKKRINLELEGSYLRFKVNIDNILFSSSDEDLDVSITNFCSKLNSKYVDLQFTLDHGWITYYKYGFLQFIDTFTTEKSAFLKNEIEVENFCMHNYFSETKLFFQNSKLFLFLQSNLLNETYFFKPTEKACLDHNFCRTNKEITFDDFRFKLVSIKNNILSVDIFFKHNQIYINTDSELCFVEKTSLIALQDYNKFLQNKSLIYLSDFLDYVRVTDGNKNLKFVLRSDYIECIYNNHKLNVYEKYCVIYNLKIENTKSYLDFFFFVYIFAEHINEIYLSVTIADFNICFDCAKGRVVSNFENKEILKLKNINYVMKNYRHLCNLNFIPNLVTQKFAVFCFDKPYVVYFSDLEVNDSLLWFNKAKKYMIDDEKQVFVECKDFSNAYIKFR